jgi:hypothetical protein
VSILLCDLASSWFLTPLRASLDGPRLPKTPPRSCFAHGVQRLSWARRCVVRSYPPIGNRRAAGRPRVLAVLAVGPGRVCNLSWGGARGRASGVRSWAHGGFGSHRSAWPVSTSSGHSGSRRSSSQGLSRRAVLRERQLPSPDLRQQGAGVAHIPCGLSVLDHGEDRLEQRARIVGCTCLAP